MSLLSSHWPKKEQGYELLDGNGSSRCSSPVDSESSPSSHYYSSYHHYHNKSGNNEGNTFTSNTISTARRILRKRMTLLFLALIITITIMQPILNIIFQPPAYVVIEPSEYTQTLKESLESKLHFDDASTRDKLEKNLLQVTRASSSSIDAAIPDTLFSSDKVAPSSEWAAMWKDMGFNTKFFDDAQADNWVENNYKGTEVYSAWKKLPRTILRADMLRYLLLLLEGGTWSDMDTVPVQHFTNWSSHSNIHSTSNASTTPSPISSVVGIECVPMWWSLRGFLEMINIKPINRHRSLQFVQWTIHIAPHHPIMLDVVRRILETMNLYDAYRIEQDREKHKMGWKWHQDDALTSRKSSKTIDNGRPVTAPWESISQQWMFTQGHWRLGWHPTSVEEWTGPGVYTDAVVSYIFATTGIRPEQIAKITEPTQFGDLLILPAEGFAPPRGSYLNPYKMSRVVHLYRGSWKKKIASGRSSK